MAVEVLLSRASTVVAAPADTAARVFNPYWEAEAERRAERERLAGSFRAVVEAPEHNPSA